MTESIEPHPSDLSPEEIDEIEEVTGQKSTIKKLRSAVFRGVLVVGALVLSGFILLSTFDDLDFQAIIDSVKLPR